MITLDRCSEGWSYWKSVYVFDKTTNGWGY